MNTLLDQTYWGNTVLAYCIATGSILLVWIVLKLVRKKGIDFLTRLASKTHTGFDDLLIKSADKYLIPYVYLYINYSIIKQLNLSARVAGVLEVAMILITAYYVIRLATFMIHGVVIVLMQHRNEPPERVRQLSGILLVVKAIVWLIGIVMLIDNLGYNVTTIIAGLGVGGIAIALAAQNILGDLFSYLVIFFDKPFEVGDFIVVGSDNGVVEKIGIKTTHVRSLSGEQLVMPNSETVKQVIRNFKTLQRRRVVFSVAVVYATPATMLKQIPAMLKEIIESFTLTAFDRAHLSSLGDSSINFEIVYFIDSADYTLYMDIQHGICIAILEKFAENKIEFAFPTQTLFVQKQDNAYSDKEIAV